MLFDLPQERSSIIKVFGIGGGGCNAVNHMFRQGIKDVNFVICNTDAQALESSPVPNRVQLGPELTKGRGAGNHPEMGQAATLESMEEIRDLLEANTEMVFITAGMGGGTGTGGAPVVARIARDMGVLTVGIVTLPFSFEGKKRVAQAQKGIEELKEHVDSIIVIVNDKIREVYGNLGFSEAFARADDILTTAARGIAEIITITGYVNVDFEDVKTVLRDSGVAIMGTGVASGEHRAIEAVESALSSPLLNDTDIRGARHVLLNITSGAREVLMDEISEITEYVQEAAGMEADIIWGNCHDEDLGEELSVTVIATGFEVDQRAARREASAQTPVVHTLEERREADPEPEARPDEPTLHRLDTDEERMAWQTGRRSAAETPAPSEPPRPEAPAVRVGSVEPPRVSDAEEEREGTLRPAPEAFQGDTVGRARPVADESDEIPQDPNQITFEFEGPFVPRVRREADRPSAEGHAEPRPESAEELPMGWRVEPAHLEPEAVDGPSAEGPAPTDDVPAERVIRPEDLPAARPAAGNGAKPGLRVRTVYPDGEWAKPPQPRAASGEDAPPPAPRQPEPPRAEPPRPDAGLPPAMPTTDDGLVLRRSEAARSGGADLSAQEQEEIIRRNEERRRRLRTMSVRVTDRNVEELENTPAYRRREIHLSDVPHSSEEGVSRYQLGEGGDGEFRRRNNSFLHDNVD